MLTLFIDRLLMPRAVLDPNILTSLNSYKASLRRDQQFAKDQKILSKEVLEKYHLVLDLECASGACWVPLPSFGIPCPLFQPLMLPLSRCLFIGATSKGLASCSRLTPLLELPEFALELLWATWDLCVDQPWIVGEYVLGSDLWPMKHKC